MTYEELIPFLNHRHFYPDIQIEKGMDKETIVGLHVQCSPIMRDSKTESLKKALEGTGAIIERIPNKTYLLVTLPK